MFQPPDPEVRPDENRTAIDAGASAPVQDPTFSAAAYAPASRELQLSGFQYLLSLHDFRGNEFVVDLASGTGAATVTDLLPRVPRGWVVGVDIAPDMVAAARRLHAERTEFFVGDIEKLAEVPGLTFPPASVDVFVSNYGMHWILGRERMQAFLKQVHDALKPDGILLSLFAENRIFPGFFERMGEVIERERWAPYFDNGRFRHHPLPELSWYETDLPAAGFQIERLGLREKWISFANKDALVRGVLGWLPQYINRLPADLREPFAAEVVERYAQSTPSIPGYPVYQNGEIGVFDVSIVLKARKQAV